MKFNCPHCEQKLSATPDLFGQEMPCPNCGNGLVVPTEQINPPSIQKENADTGRPRTIVLRSTAKKVWRGLIASLVLTGGGIWMFVNSANSGTTTNMWGINLSDSWMSLFCLVFGIFMFGISTLMLTSDQFSGLHLDQNGFTYYSFFRARRVFWRDIMTLGVERLGGFDYVAWKYASTATRPNSGVFTNMQTMRRWWGGRSFPDARKSPLPHIVTVASALPDILTQDNEQSASGSSDDGFMAATSGMEAERLLTLGSVYEFLAMRKAATKKRAAENVEWSLS